jgi:hypothetical protein
LGCTQVTSKEGFILALSNRVLARKLGYGVAYSDGAGEANDFGETAKSQLEYIPEFHPWKFIATHDQSKINLNDLRYDFQNDLDKRSTWGGTKTQQVQIAADDGLGYSIEVMVEHM